MVWIMSRFSFMLNPDFQLNFSGTSSHFQPRVKQLNLDRAPGTERRQRGQVPYHSPRSEPFRVNSSSWKFCLSLTQRLGGGAEAVQWQSVYRRRRRRGVGGEKTRDTSLSFSVIITAIISCRHGEKNKATPSPCFLFSTCYSSTTCQRQSSRRVEEGVGEGWGQEGGGKRGLWQRDKQLERGGGGGGDTKKKWGWEAGGLKSQMVCNVRSATY